MKRKCFLLIATFTVIFSGKVFAEESMLPYKGGTTWTCTQGNYLDPDNHWDAQLKQLVAYETNKTHNTTYSNGELKYAIDFGLPLNTPVVASHSGQVTFAGVSGGWGKCILIDYGNGRIGRYAHLSKLIVCEGYVTQGQVIGNSGSTGYSDGPHLHYQEENSNGQSQPVLFIDVEETDRIPKRFVPVNENPNGLRHYYTSMNTYNPYNNFHIGQFVVDQLTGGWRIEPFDVCTNDYVFSRPFAMTYFHFGGLNALGHPATTVYQASIYQMPGYDPLKGVELPWIQDVTNTSGGEAWLTLVINPYVKNSRMGHDGQTIYGVVYPVLGQIRNYWRAHYSSYGTPASNEYYWPDSQTGPHVIQWFECGKGRYFRISYDTRDGSFNDAETLGAMFGNIGIMSTWKNIGCPDGICGTGGGESDEDYTFNRSTTAKSADPNSPYLPIDETNQFYVFDGQNYQNEFVCWLQVDNISKRIPVEFKIYDANGNLVKDSLQYIGEEGVVNGCWRVFTPCNFANTESFGLWWADIYLDSIFVASNYFTVNIVLNAPTNLSATSPTNSSVTISWQPVSGAYGYKIYRNNSFLLDTAQNIYTYTDNNLQPNSAYNYQVRAKRGNAMSDYSSTLSITTLPNPPIANFTASPASGISPLSVNFTNTSSGSITSYAWNFGDGSTSASASLTHVYSTAGTYTATLTVTGPGGTNAKTATITVTAPPLPPIANFTTSTTSGTSPLTVNFTNSSTGQITSYAWNFGDGATSTSANPVHIFTIAGTYSATLTVTGPGGTNAKTAVITVTTPPPIANFTASPTSGTSPLTVNFTNTSSGPISSYAWNFGDGSTSASASPTHVYSTAGTYTATLTVTGPGGTNAKTATITVTAPPLPPIANFTTSTTSGTSPLTVNFTNSSTGQITSYAWNFGDGATSTSANPVHIFTIAGTYSATLTVTGPGGTNAKTAVITVTTPPPIANFTASPTSGTSPLTVNFTNTSSGPISSYVWNFGDGSTSTSAGPAHIYATAGTYTATLTVTGLGGTSTKTATITVTAPPPPTANFTADPTSGIAPLTVVFANSSTGYTSISWDFGDGTTSVALNPTHVFATAGTYTVILTATGAGGVNSKTLTITATASSSPLVADFTTSRTIGNIPLTVSFTNKSTGGIVSFLWDFGDGQTSTNASTTHVYTIAGIYTATLTVTGPGGSNDKTVTITVLLPPEQDKTPPAVPEGVNTDIVH